MPNSLHMLFIIAIVEASSQSKAFLRYLDLFNMMRKEQLFLGGSSGCVVTGTDQYLQLHKIANKKVVIVSHDRGDRYFANLYSKHPEFMD